MAPNFCRAIYIRMLARKKLKLETDTGSSGIVTTTTTLGSPPALSVMGGASPRGGLTRKPLAVATPPESKRTPSKASAVARNLMSSSPMGAPAGRGTPSGTYAAPRFRKLVSKCDWDRQPFEKKFLWSTGHVYFRLVPQESNSRVMNKHSCEN